jgi:death on curing protein
VIDWLTRDVVEKTHDEELARHGGQPGVLSAAKLQATLDRPRNLLAYQEPDLADLAGRTPTA